MATSKITDGPDWSIRCTVRSNRSSMTSVSDSRRSKRRVLTTPEITTCNASMLRTRAIGMKIRCRANSSTTRPFTRGACPSARRCTTTSRTLPTWSPASSRTGRFRIREMKTEVAEVATGRLSLRCHADQVIEFQDLCLDVADVSTAAAFWGPTLGLRPDPDRPECLVDGVPEHTLWLNAVPEPKTVKHRVHLDVHVAAVADLIALGATVRGDSQPWTDMSDPEGGELCAFVRDPATLTDYRLYEVVVDSADPAMIATWWAEQFGVPVEHERDRGVLLAGGTARTALRAGVRPGARAQDGQEPAALGRTRGGR